MEKEMLGLPESPKELPEGESEEPEYTDAEYEEIKDDYPYEEPENAE